jgi:hypothetical protein
MIFWLVVSTPLKNISQIGSSSQLLGKIKMFQTTNQYCLVVGSTPQEKKARQLGASSHLYPFLGLKRVEN